MVTYVQKPRLKVGKNEVRIPPMAITRTADDKNSDVKRTLSGVLWTTFTSERRLKDDLSLNRGKPTLRHEETSTETTATGCLMSNSFSSDCQDVPNNGKLKSFLWKSLSLRTMYTFPISSLKGF